ncbi:MAG: FtsQ-type POTRA domain-containing protein [Alphaproteobacteria bacterium]
MRRVKDSAAPVPVSVPAPSSRTRAKPATAPRARVAPLWRRRALRLSVAVVLLGALSGGGVWVWRNGAAEPVGAMVRAETTRLAVDAGFRLDDIRVLGRVHTRPEHILAALGIRRGESLLDFDIERAKTRIEALPWVRDAVVERRLPDMLRLTITERQAVALWQHDGRFVLLDPDGHQIADDIDAFRHLPLLVGDRVPQQAMQFFALLGSQPALAARVKAAVLVSGRRWNLKLDNVDHGIDVRLPEENAAEALKRLADFDREHGLLKRKLVMVDMRVPDRLVVRMEGADEKDQVLPALGAGPGRDA